MRLRAGLILFLFIALVGGGCRKPLAPTFDRNQAPETWITAAPLDTVISRDPLTKSPIAPVPGKIPFRYHLYWAGSDPDGKVVGFYFAVTETLPSAPAGFTTPPPLPGPKPSDYHYTTKTDSVFIFDVAPGISSRQHVFYIYAVDNEGKADPMPARFIFSASDRFPPRPVIDSFVATGFIWTQTGWPGSLTLNRILTADSLSPADTFGIGVPLNATVPSSSRLDIKWHSEITTVGNPALGYQYKLDEPDFLSADVSVTSKTYNSGASDRVGPGVKIFRLRALDAANFTGETNRYFQMNMRPAAWFAGPDRSAPIWKVSGNDHYIDVDPRVAIIPNLQGISLLSADSTQILPSQRTPRKTFLEIWSNPALTPPLNRIYARQEGDTVHMNSWLIFSSGGFDPDSPYSVTYKSTDKYAPDSTLSPVVQIRPSNGSPVGFRSRVPELLTPGKQSTSPTQSGVTPYFDPASVFWSPAVNQYTSVLQAGTAYFVTRAQDGDGLLDDRVGSRSDLQPITIATVVDSFKDERGNPAVPNPDQIALRPQILRFFVDFPPALTLASGTHPVPNDVFASRILSVNMPATDSDPFDPGQPPNGPGGPSNSFIFRYTVWFRAHRRGSADPADSVTYLPSTLNQLVQSAPATATITLGDSLGDPGPLGTKVSVRVIVELCDCATCELSPGQGRCAYYSYLISVPAIPSATATPASPSGPGSAAALDERRRGQQ